MNHDIGTVRSTDRDRAVERAGRLRRTLVGTSAAASLGLAAVLGVGALGSSSASTAAQGSTGTSTGGSAGTSSSTSSSSSQSTAPGLSAGSGSSHASTSGS